MSFLKGVFRGGARDPAVTCNIGLQERNEIILSLAVYCSGPYRNIEHSSGYASKTNILLTQHYIFAGRLNVEIHIKFLVVLIPYVV